MTLEEYKKQIRNNSNATVFGGKAFQERLTTNSELIRTGGFKPYESRFAFNPNLDTTEGLYKLSVKAGLGDKANKAIEKAGGTNSQFWSGGFLMDTMDTLNALQYGVTGLIKGRTFAEGVKNRESFADEDFLGKHGWMGKIAGFVLDIVVDPLTYVSPWKQVSRIPGVAKTLDKTKDKIFGDMQRIEIDGQSVTFRDGGWSPMTYLANKFVYGFAVDKKFLEGYQEIIGKHENLLSDAGQLMRVFETINPAVAKKTIAIDDRGFQISRKLEDVKADLKREMPAEQYRKLEPALDEMYRMRDTFMQELVDEGVISKAASDEWWGRYLKNEYDDYLIEKGKQGSRQRVGTSVDNRGRNYELTKEERLALNPIEDAGVVWAATLTKQIEQLRNARLNRFVANNFGLSAEQLPEYLRKGGDLDQLFKVPETPNYRITGTENDLKLAVSTLKKNLNSVIKERRKIFKDDKEITSTLRKLEDQIGKIKAETPEQLEDALNGFRKIAEESGITFGPAKKKATTQGQKILEADIQKWLNSGRKSDRLARETMSSRDLMREYLKTPGGWALTRAFDNPKTMYQWQNASEFFDAVRYPDKKKILTDRKEEIAELTEKQQDRIIEGSVEKMKTLGKLEQEKLVLSTTNQKLIKEAMEAVEDKYADLLFEKKKLLEALNENKMGQLAGKYIPKPMWDMLKETNNPDPQLAEPIVMAFKKMKVIWNPAAYPRNAISAMIQNWWKLGLGPWRLDVYLDAYREMKNGGIYLQKMKNLGFSQNTGYLAELRGNYLSGKDGSIFKSVQRQQGWTEKQTRQFFKKIDNSLTTTYGHVDDVAKVAAFKALVKKGVEPEEALKQAYAATFNYSQVTPFVHQMRRAIWGVPFITFSLKAAPLVASTLANNPNRISVFGKAKNALFQAAGVEAEQEAETQPEWMAESFMLRLPWKDQNGRSMYFDLSYILPFGAIMTGEYLKDPLASNPVLQTVRELSRNETFAGRKIFREFDDHEKVITDIFIHVSKLMMPPIAAGELSQGYDSNGNKVFTGLRKSLTTPVEDLGPSERTIYQEMFRHIGANVRPFDPDSARSSFEWRRKENLQRMLVENGILDEFTRPYLPEDSELQGQPALKKNLFQAEKDIFTRQ